MSVAQPVNSRTQARWWIATIPAESWDGRSLPSFAKYAKGQKETGESGYLHWQVVFQCAKPTRRSKFSSWISGAFYEPTRSAQALEYVWKEDTRVQDSQFELGERLLQRNSAKDWEEVWSKAKRGDLEGVPADIRVRYFRTLRSIANEYVKPSPMERTCRLFVGPTGTGKSYRAWQEAGFDAYSKSPTTKWWDGYKGEANVIIDEFRY